MDPITQQTTLASAGGKKDPVYVDDVFSTYVYAGNGTTRTITNGIDLAGEGGLVWIKVRTSAYNSALYDTERGTNSSLSSNQADAEQTGYSNRVTGYLSNGFTLGNNTIVNNTPNDFVSWTFRKAPGFFDVVTWNGDGTNPRQIAHSLGSTPGMIWIKSTSDARHWVVYHRGTSSSAPESNLLILNETDASVVQDWFAQTAPTSTHFSVEGSSNVNASGKSYVAYIFAHDDAQFGTDEDESIIKCGSFTGGGSTSNPKYTDIGFEPQFVLFKRTDSSSQGDWYMMDIMRGMANDTNNQTLLRANTSDEDSNSYRFWVHQNGFATTEDLGNGNFIYMAIRRPNKPPEVATDVFAIDYASGSSTIPNWDSGFPVDFALWRENPAAVNNNHASSRLTGTEYLRTNLMNVAAGAGNIKWDSNVGYGKGYNSTYLSWMFKRAPGFMDVVAYSGTGSTRTVNHNLTVPPELMIIKLRNEVNNWAVYYGDNTHYMRLNSSSSGADSAAWWNDTSPTSTEFTVGTDPEVNKSSYSLIAYLFATLPGISKVGGYTGTGNAINVDCGFTNGARFVLIKRTDSSGRWMLFDSLRGIVSGNDPALELDTSNAQVTGTDYIDSLSTGFTVASAAPATVNASGGTYIFLAIA